MTDLSGATAVPIGGLADTLSGSPGGTASAMASDVRRFEQAMQQGAHPIAPAAGEPGSPPAAAAAAVSAPERLGDAILGTLSRLSSLHHDTRQQVGQVLSAPETELSPRRMLEVQTALSDLSLATQLAANVTTQVARVVDQTAKMQ